MSRQGSRFFIDLSSGNVFCSTCRRKCRSLQLAEYTLFWCANKACGNGDEVRLRPSSGWEIHSVRETLRENAVSEVTTRLVRSIRTAKRKSSTPSK